MSRPQDRVRQLALLAGLKASPLTLRRDECGDWRINGGAGHIYADGDGWLIYGAAGSPRRWTFVKAALGFCDVTQDGDDEGCLHLPTLPDEIQAPTIRKVLRIRKRRDPDPTALARLFHYRAKQGVSAPETAADASPVGREPADATAVLEGEAAEEHL